MAQNSVLSSGKWFKVSVTQEGIHQIDYALLKKLGAEPDKINPATLKIYAYPNGMLPQANSITRQQDLKEIAIMVVGEGDGKFNSSDKIYFFAEGPDATLHRLSPQKLGLIVDFLRQDWHVAPAESDEPAPKE